MTDKPCPQIDISVPHSARIWNYWLGGKDHYPADRHAGDAYRQVFPGIEHLARTARYFLARAVTYLVADAGIRQLLDIGTGLPTVDNTHLPDEQAYPAVAQLVAALPPGSYLALYDGASTSAAFTKAQDGYNRSGAEPYYLPAPRGAL